jgi:ubiquitin C-terminal hydrolase
MNTVTEHWTRQMPHRHMPHRQMPYGQTYDDDIVQTYGNIIHNVGLENFGNTCYLNTIIQTLFHLDTFKNVINKDHILELFCQKKSIQDLDNSNIMNLKNLFTILAEKKMKKVEPIAFRSGLQLNNDLFNNDDQQDVQEAFIMILEIIHNEISQKIEMPSCDSSDLNEAIRIHWFNNYSPVYNLFHGMYYTSRRCTNCAHKKTNYEPNCFLGLDIPKVENNNVNIDYASFLILKCKIPSIKLSDVEIQMMESCLSANTKQQLQIVDRNMRESTIEYSIQDCIDEYHTSKIIENVRCSNCNLNYNHTCTYGIAIVPKILMIQLKRFKYDGSKIYNHIILQHMITIPCESGDKMYRLSSIINHTGPNTLCGHYYMYNYNKRNDCWYKYNDASVTKIQEKTINNSESYLLFYELIN